jgi:hypothetical protein
MVSLTFHLYRSKQVRAMSVATGSSPRAGILDAIRLKSQRLFAHGTNHVIAEMSGGHDVCGRAC